MMALKCHSPPMKMLVLDGFGSIHRFQTYPIDGNWYNSLKKVQKVWQNHLLGTTMSVERITFCPERRPLNADLLEMQLGLTRMTRLVKSNATPYFVFSSFGWTCLTMGYCSSQQLTETG